MAKGKPKPDKFGCVHYSICPVCETKLLPLRHFDLNGKNGVKLTIGEVCPNCDYEYYYLGAAGVYCGENPIWVIEENGKVVCRSDELEYGKKGKAVRF